MTINLNGNLMDLSTPKIMGILNVTPDSFYDGGMFDSNKKILDHVEKMLTDGADIIDVGGYSSRPGAKEVKLKDEIKRVVPTIELIKKEFNETTISVDTFRSEVALQAVNSGASIINDISGGDLDPNMFNCVAELNVPYIIMHMQGNPKNMQNNPLYENVIVEIIENLSKKVIYRSTHRGSKEMDILLGNFVKKHIKDFSANDLEELILLLEVDDEEIYNWYFKNSSFFSTS